jgi:hypothetical protein
VLEYPLRLGKPGILLYQPSHRDHFFIPPLKRPPTSQTVNSQAHARQQQRQLPATRAWSSRSQRRAARQPAKGLQAAARKVCQARPHLTAPTACVALGLFHYLLNNLTCMDDRSWLRPRTILGSLCTLGPRQHPADLLMCTMTTSTCRWFKWSASDQAGLTR